MQHQPPPATRGPPRSPPALRASLTLATVPLVVLLALQWPLVVLAAALAAATTGVWCAVRRHGDGWTRRVRPVRAVFRR